MTPQLTSNARLVLETRYLRRDDSGRVVETPSGLFQRVASFVAGRESSKMRVEWSARFYEMMASRRFIPNTPTLINAGRPQGQLSACFVLPVVDSLEGIFEALKQAAKIHQSGGGTGFAFSRLRARGSVVRSTHGVASGPVSFIRIFDVATETIKQGGARRGANMAVLRADHPDIFEFVDSKRDLRSIANFNISVGATDEFMWAAMTDQSFGLRDPGTGQILKEVRARELMDRIVRSAWECGDPGLVFLDRVNQFNPTPRLGPMESTNPCGEQPLLAFESCNLGSLNLGEYVRGNAFDWGLFRSDIHQAVRFLDNVIDLNSYPIEESRELTLKNRKIGLGVMGFADLLLLLGVPYDDRRAVEWGEKVMSFLDREAKRASAELSVSRGAFPSFRGSMWDRLGFPALRNATVSTVAPTGTISIIAGASSGIEPIFAGVFYRNVLSGARLREVHPAVERALQNQGRLSAAVSDEAISEALGEAWSPAWKVSVAGHVAIQAAFQRHSDSAVSKTVNFPAEATEEQVRAAYFQAFLAGCKGITVYRDQSRPGQVLERASAEDEDLGALGQGEACPSC